MALDLRVARSDARDHLAADDRWIYGDHGLGGAGIAGVAADARGGGAGHGFAHRRLTSSRVTSGIRSAHEREHVSIMSQSSARLKMITSKGADADRAPEFERLEDAVRRVTSHRCATPSRAWTHRLVGAGGMAGIVCPRRTTSGTPYHRLLPITGHYRK